MNAHYIKNWDNFLLGSNWGLAFIDLAPGEYRQTMVVRMKPLADIIVVHDTEIGGAGNYGFNFDSFRYQLHYNRTGGGAGASMLSETVDVNAYRGLTLKTFKFDE